MESLTLMKLNEVECKEQKFLIDSQLWKTQTMMWILTEPVTLL
jgi:hypothetical protein